jgi:hypothetical protein|tara:strand:+ start:897 stop:1007 length:111 start_codon:yes stop_codon:yes gene_type:complete
MIKKLLKKYLIKLLLFDRDAQYVVRQIVLTNIRKKK